MSAAASIDTADLPLWACVSERRRAHIARVTALLDRWAAELHIDAGEARAWRDAGRFHDALRDASEEELRAITGDNESPYKILHGPAAAIRLRADGESRNEVLEAIRWHTIGTASWGRCGRALFMADYLDPGRAFAQTDRAFLAAHVATDFDGVFRQVVRQRLEWSLREGKGLFPETVAVWNAVR
jgi:HD superfamily phosphohydrolase YqeK